MNLSAAEVDKIREISQKKAVEGFSPMLNRRGFPRHFLWFLQENWMYLVIGGLFLLGLLIGTQLVRCAADQTLELLKMVLGGYLERRKIQSFAAITTSTFCSLFLSLLVLFFCGFCTISQPISLGVPLFRGLGYGFSIGMFYTQNGVSAVPYVALMMTPAIVLGAALLVVACRASLRLSVTLFRSTLINTAQNDRLRIQRYCTKYIVFTMLCFIISLLDAVIVYKFSSLFVL